MKSKRCTRLFITKLLRKGTNITLKKIDCISAVNVLPGDPLNFPDLDISNLLMSESHRTSIASTSTLLNPETGRKSFSLGTPFSTPSSNALQGSDFASAIGDSDFGSMNDHDHEPMEMFPLRQMNTNHPTLSSQSDNYEFQVPDELKRKTQRGKRFKNSLMDHELMLEKDQLFINESDLHKYKNAKNESNDPFKVALKLLNSPNDFFFESETSLKTSKLNFAYEYPRSENEATCKDLSNVSFDNYMDNDGYYAHDEIEVYRNDPTRLSFSSSTPRNLILPWSSSSSDALKINNQLSSAAINTPIRKGLFGTAGQSTPSPLTDLAASSSSISLKSSSPFKDFTSSLSQETFDFFYFLQEKIIESKPASKSTITFTNVLPKGKTSRAVAARAFHHLLELKSGSLVDVKQSRPFSDIQILIE